MHRLEKLSAVQKKIEDRNLAKNGMLEPLACVCIEILVIPYNRYRAENCFRRIYFTALYKSCVV